MFTGIVQGTAEVVTIIEKEQFRSHTLSFPADWLQGLEIGASVAHNGCCLTVTKIDQNLVSFDLIAETLKLTNLGELQPGDRVNIERAARFGDEIGGHTVSGHIMTTLPIIDIKRTDTNCQIWLALTPQLAPYIFHKGFVALDGISLTIGDVTATSFNVNLIPETLSRTNLSWRKPGDRINIEVDAQTQAIVDTVERVLAQRQSLSNGQHPAV